MEKTRTGREEMVSWLFSLENMGIKLGLENMMKLLARLGNPEVTFKSIHVAGTNGKGSTSAFIASILMSEGYRTGLYTSPHFVELEERIKINGRQIPEDALLEIGTEVRRAAEELFGTERRQITFFEITTAIAFVHFARSKVDYAVIEVGLGGRLDATNVITPMASVITHIALEHTAYLGNTVESIAREKGGIIKPGIPVITAESKAGAFGEIASLARANHSELSRSGDLADVRTLENSWGVLAVEVRGAVEIDELRSGLWGTYQIENLGLAISTAEVLQRAGVYLSDRAIRNGIENVSWRGRLQRARSTREFVFDSAHNPDAMMALSASVRDASSDDFLLVLGILSDKNMEEMMPFIARLSSHAICTSPKTPRARSAAEIAASASKHGISAAEAGSVGEGMEHALSERTGRKVLVTGSLRTVGEAMEWWYAKYGERLWS